MIIEMFSEQEQEGVINQFLDVLEMKKIINNKVSMCPRCKFTPQNMNLHHLSLSDTIVQKMYVHIVTKNVSHAPR